MSMSTGPMGLLQRVNPSHATVPFVYLLKTSENLWFSVVFRRYRKRPMAWNGLKRQKPPRNSAKLKSRDIKWAIANKVAGWKNYKSKGVIES